MDTEEGTAPNRQGGRKDEFIDVDCKETLGTPDGTSACEVCPEPMEQSVDGLSETDLRARYERARAIVHQYASYSLVSGLVPVPLVDGLVMSAVHLKMLYELTDLYGMEYDKDRALRVSVALVGGLGTAGVARWLGAHVLRGVPLVGTLVRVFSAPAISCATAYALGHVFIAHFEMGGTLFDFDPVKTRAFFEKCFRERLAEGLA